MSKINAKIEFLDTTRSFKVIAADISFNGWDHDDDDYINCSFKLKPLYNSNDYDKFLKFLDREYDNGFGGQQLYGIIYCEKGVWMDRGEYDGSEWWDINKYPDLIKSFDESDVIKYERREKLNNIKNNNF